jgi:glycosyltransferase involved in cell wall biosynthesis
MQQINELKIGSNVKVIDKYVPNEDVATYFSAADVVVLPYVSGTGSGVVQIAFGFTKPVIATKVGCLPDVVAEGKTGYLVGPKDSVGIADAVLSFYKNKMERKMIRNIILNRDMFSWTRMVGIIEAVAEGKQKCQQGQR